jgi:hypothetical protein
VKSNAYPAAPALIMEANWQKEKKHPYELEFIMTDIIFIK